VLALVFFFAIARYGARQARVRGGTTSDTTIVSGDTTGGTTGSTESGDSIPVIQPLEGEGGTGDQGTQPGDAASTDDNKPGLKEIRPADGDSTL
jgi:hypothetical protein